MAMLTPLINANNKAVTTPIPIPRRPSRSSVTALMSMRYTPMAMRNQRSPRYDQRTGVDDFAARASNLASHGIGQEV